MAGGGSGDRSARFFRSPARDRDFALIFSLSFIFTISLGKNSPLDIIDFSRNSLQSFHLRFLTV